MHIACLMSMISGSVPRTIPVFLTSHPCQCQHLFVLDSGGVAMYIICMDASCYASVLFSNMYV